MSETSNRRGFLDTLLKGGLAACGVGMTAPTLIYLWPARTGGGKAISVSAGPLKEFPVGGAKMLQAEGRPILVLRLSEDAFRAFSPICTHLGCIVKWDAQQKKILCPCHAGEFNTDGKNVSGPPPRPLVAYAVGIVGSEVMVRL